MGCQVRGRWSRTFRPGAAAAFRSQSVAQPACTHRRDRRRPVTPCMGGSALRRIASQLVVQRRHRARRGHRATCSSRSLLSMIQRRMSRLRIIVSKTSWHFCTERRPLGMRSRSMIDQCHSRHLRFWAYSLHSKRQHRQNLAGEDEASGRHETPLRIDAREDGLLKHLKKHR